MLRRYLDTHIDRERPTQSPRDNQTDDAGLRCVAIHLASPSFMHKLGNSWISQAYHAMSGQDGVPWLYISVVHRAAGHGTGVRW